MERYRNVDETDSYRGLKHVLRWKLGLGPDTQPSSPRRVAVPVIANDGVALRGATRPALTWIGHATYLVQLGGRSILTDPILSPRVAVLARNVAPGLTYETLPSIDVALVSHNHFDHMDAPTLRRLGRSVTFVVAKGLAPWFRHHGLNKVVELGWWEHTDVGGVRITFVPSQHWSRRGLLDENKTLWGGFVMESDGKRVYHSGDTAYFTGFKEIGARFGKIDAALLPIGAYAPRWFMRPQHMNPEDAVTAFTDLGAEQFFAMHWGTFKLTDEPLDEPPTFLQDVWHARKLETERMNILAIGETRAL